MYQNPIEAYTSIQKENLTGRELEASILTRAGLMLKNVQDNWDASDKEEKLMEAIKFNQKVWSFFQAELSDPENALPINIRQDILSLSLSLICLKVFKQSCFIGLCVNRKNCYYKQNREDKLFHIVFFPKLVYEVGNQFLPGMLQILQPTNQVIYCPGKLLNFS
ncbi:MAG: hypothetical protein HGA85_07165 [Nanoarchaeota archaeon]|nr:hypothetical protein [Nanoarchaeota archaeon]